MRRLASLVLFEFCMLALSAFAQHEGHESVGRVPREILERPVPLRQGIGKVHEEVTTSSPKAQAFYDQGLAYLHSFVWIEAARSFHQALRFEPSLAIDRKSTRLNSSHVAISYAVFCLKKKKKKII